MESCFMKITSRALLITALFMAPASSVFAWDSNDNSERLSGGSSNVFSPGYINAAKQQSSAVSRQVDTEKSWWENLMDKLNVKTDTNVEEAADTKAQPELKKKTSSNAVDSNARSSVISAGSALDIPRGSGTNQEFYPGSTNLLAEVINGTRYVYAGFYGKDYDTLSASLSRSNSGDTIIVKTGYLANETSTVTIGKSISIYGGYNDDGTREGSAKSEMAGGFNASFLYTSKVVIDGMKFSTARIMMSNNITINGNTLGDIIAYYSTVSITNSTIKGSKSSFGGCLVSMSNNDITFSGHFADFNYGSIVTSANNNYINEGDISQVTMYLNHSSTIASDGDYFMSSPVIRRNGFLYYLSFTAPTQNVRGAGDAVAGKGGLETSTVLSSRSSDYWRNISSSNIYGTYGILPYESFSRLASNPLSKSAVPEIFKGLLANMYALKTGIGPNDKGEPDRGLVVKLVAESLGLETLNAPITGQETADQMSVAMAIAKILKDPTQMQKLILDAIDGLLKDIQDVQEKAGFNQELNKSENDLLQMAVAALLAQDVPELLRAGDVESINGIFRDLGQAKEKLMLDYSQSIKPYYSSVVKELSVNLYALQLKGMLSKNITEEELCNLEPREIGRILDRIRKANDKSFELQDIIQQDTKYRKDYLDPQSRALQDNIRIMLASFTGRIGKALEEKSR